jgi:hypothetical protein
MIALTASGVALWAVSAKASDAYGNAYHQAPSSTFYYPTAQAWPKVDHAPAITKTLRYAPQDQVAPAPSQTYDYDWQRQPAPAAPQQAHPQFSHPQQGYYPQEGQTQQAPGYEYDFGGAGTYPPLYPMEGANWRAPRVYVPTNVKKPSHGTYAHCPR